MSAVVHIYTPLRPVLLRCSFCQKDQNEVKKLITNSSLDKDKQKIICNECVVQFKFAIICSE